MSNIPYSKDEIFNLCATRLAHEKTEDELQYAEVFKKNLAKAERELKDYPPHVLREAFASYVWHGLPQTHVEPKRFDEILSALNDSLDGTITLKMQVGDRIDTVFGPATVVSWRTALTDPAVERDDGFIPVRFEVSEKNSVASLGTVHQKHVTDVISHNTRKRTTTVAEIVREKKSRRRCRR